MNLKNGTLPDTICPLPWINMSIDVDGSFRPCCKFYYQNKPNYNMGNLKEQTIEGLWHSEGMVKLRQQFRLGAKPVECANCWREEEAGIVSYRQEFLIGRVDNPEIDYSTDFPSAPKTLDLKMSNVCNLKCRICGPISSSLWLNETVEFEPDSRAFLESKKEFLLGNKITKNEVNLATFKAWLPHLRHIEIFGGEPLLSRENRELEDLLVSAQVAKDITLLYNTNTTLFSDALIETWMKFKKVTVCLSVDDIEERFEYQRNPAKWDIVEKNVKKYSEIKSTKIDVMLFCSVSNFNVWYLPQYIMWATENTPQLRIALNLVHNSSEFCITNLPKSLKSKIRKKYELSIANREVPAGTELIEKMMGILSFMESKEDLPEKWSDFLKEVKKIDKRRGQDFESVFPLFFREVIDTESTLRIQKHP